MTSPPMLATRSRMPITTPAATPATAPYETGALLVAGRLADVPVAKILRDAVVGVGVILGYAVESVLEECVEVVELDEDVVIALESVDDVVGINNVVAV